MGQAPPLLEVRGLSTVFRVDGKELRAVNDVSFSVAAGERFGLVGESGSGKTVTALSIMGLLDAGGVVENGEILVEGRDLRLLSERDYVRVRGSQIAMIPQDPLASLNPVIRIGDQMVETIKRHHRIGRRPARAEAVRLLSEVGLPDAAKRLGEYPHQLSGGMRQRVMIALALSGEPRLVIADEPTTALDVTIQAQVMELLSFLAQKRGTAVLLITHDLGLIAGFAERVGVMYAGRLVEQADTDELFARPSHPYTRGLLAAVSRIDRPRSDHVMTIPGQPPDLTELPTGCSFHPRCSLSDDRGRCRQDVPAPEHVDGCHDHAVACHFWRELLIEPRR